MRCMRGSRVVVEVRWCRRTWCSVDTRWSWRRWSGIILVIDDSGIHCRSWRWIVRVFKWGSPTQVSIPWRSWVKLESFGEAIVLQISFNTKQCQTLPRPPTGFMSNKGILGGKIANAIDVHQEALHLMLQSVVMFILFLMQSNEKLSVIENTRSLPRPLSNSAFSGFSLSTVR